MVRSEGVGWIVVMEVGWHETTLDDAPEPHTHFLSFFLYNWADSCWTIRLYSKGRVLGHKRAKRNTRPNTSLIQIEGVATKEDAQFYLGKVRNYPKDISFFYTLWTNQRVAYVYKAKKEIQGSKVRVIWGCVFRYIPCHAIAHLSQLTDE